MASLTLTVTSDSSEGWQENNPILAKDELGFDTTANRLKVGDGVSEWSDLEFIGPDIVNSLTKGGIDVALSAEQGKTLKKLIDKKANLDTVIEVIDNLTDGGANKALSAEQGKKLSERLDRNENNFLELTTCVDGLGRIFNDKADRKDVIEIKEALQGVLAALEKKVDDVPYTGKHYVRRNREWEPTEAITSVTTNGVSLMIPGAASKTATPNVTAAWSSYPVPVSSAYLTGLALAGSSDTVFVAAGNTEKARISSENSTYGEAAESYTLKDWAKVTLSTNAMPSHVINASDKEHIARSFMLGAAPDVFGSTLYYYGYINGKNPVQTNLVDVISCLGYAPENDLLCAVAIDRSHKLMPFVSTVSSCGVWTRGTAIATTVGTYHGMKLVWNPVVKQFYLAVNTGTVCEIYKSSNGLTWEKSTSITESKSAYPHAMASSDNLPWVFVGGNGFAKYTKDGSYWNYCQPLNGRTITAACYAPSIGQFCVSVKGVGLMFSPDFEAWFQVSLPAGVEYFTDMEWSESRQALMAVSENTKSVFVLPLEAC